MHHTPVARRRASQARARSKHPRSTPGDWWKSAYTFADEALLGVLPDKRPSNVGLAGLATAASFFVPGPNIVKGGKKALELARSIPRAAEQLGKHYVRNYGDKVWHSPAEILSDAYGKHVRPGKLWSRNIYQAADDLWEHDVEPATMVSALMGSRSGSILETEGRGRNLWGFLNNPGSKRRMNEAILDEQADGLLLSGFANDFGDILSDVMLDRGLRKNVLNDLVPPNWYYNPRRADDIRARVGSSLHRMADKGVREAFEEMPYFERRRLGLPREYPRRK